MTTAELLAKIAEIEKNPANKGEPGSLWSYTPAARRKLDKLRREVASNMRADRLAKGLPVDDSGYSGRQSNKR